MEGFYTQKLVDLNGDGHDELLGFEGHDPTYYQGTNKIHLISASGTLVRSWSGSYDGFEMNCAVADLNNDGRKELVVSESNNENLYVVSYDLTQTLASSPGAGRVLGINDVDGDGALEIIVHQSSSRRVRVLSTSLSEKASYQVASSAGDWSEYEFAVADVDGDGLNEIVYSPYNDSLYVLGYEHTGPVTFGDGIWLPGKYAYYGDQPAEYRKRMLSELQAHGISELQINALYLNTVTEWYSLAYRQTVDTIHHYLPGARVYATLNGHTDKSPFLRLSDPEVRHSIAVGCSILCDTSKCGFDGVDLDIEGIHASDYQGVPDEGMFGYFTALLDSVESHLPPHAFLSVTVSPRFPPGDFLSMSEKCDKTCVMMYDLGQGGQYWKWVRDASATILNAVRDPNMVSIALPAANYKTGQHNPTTEKLSSGINGVNAANPRPASIIIFAPSLYEGAGYSSFDMDCCDPYNGESEWLAFDSLWHSDGRTGNVSILLVPSGKLHPNGNILSIPITWELPAHATHANVHWSIDPSGSKDQYVGLSGEGPVHTSGGMYNETIEVPADSFDAYKVHTVKLQVHADIDGRNWYSEVQSVKVAPGNSGGSQELETVDLPVASACEGAFPDPFNDATRMCYSVSGTAGSALASVSLSIVDRSGRVVKQLVHQPQPAGTYSASWDGRDDSGRKLPAGVYLCRLTIGGFSATHKVVKSK